MSWLQKKSCSTKLIFKEMIIYVAVWLLFIMSEQRQRVIEEIQQKTLFVKNLPLKVNAEQLYDLFG